MNVEYLDSFIQASSNIIEETLGEIVKVGDIQIKSSPLSCLEVMVIVGITGKIKGKAILIVQKETGLRIASSMMMGMEISELDDMSKSALGELTNMILGNAASILSKQKLFIDITPPTVIIGEHIEITNAKQYVASIPFYFSENDDCIELYLTFEEN